VLQSGEHSNKPSESIQCGESVNLLKVNSTQE
jgi:hypothetical protein